jgi:hypothetical protein
MKIEITTKLKIELCFIAFLCLSAIFVEILAFFSIMKPAYESPELWFQRSGAITSIFAVFTQLRVNNFLESIRGGTFGESWNLFKMFSKHQFIASWIVTLIAIWGAFVWGYGDLFIKPFIK